MTDTHDSSNFRASRLNRISSLKIGLKGIIGPTGLSEELSHKLKKIRERKRTASSKHQSDSEEMSPVQRKNPIEEKEEEQQVDNFLQEFQLKEKLGEGCNACVYRCVHRQTLRQYAVKKIRIEEEHIVRMKKDFIMLKELNHSSVIRYKGLYFDRSLRRLAYLVMEYLPLPSLADYKIKNQQNLKDIVLQILDALQYLHNKNICHRDIKPDNILYDEGENKIKIIDFGISKKTFLRGARRDMLTIIGTHYYIAPEVFIGGGYDERVDLWALGVTIFRIISGYTPFQSEYHSQTVANILQGEVKFSYSRWSKYSPHLKNFVGKFLNRVEKRMTIDEARLHLWITEGEISNFAPVPSLKKSRSQKIQVNEQFHKEFNEKEMSAISKEEGLELEDKKILRKIKVLSSDKYELEDSDNEESIVSPMATPNFRSTFDTFSSVSFLGQLSKSFLKEV